MADRRSSGKIGEVSLTPERIAEKRAFRDIVRGAGGLEAAEMYCRVGKSQLARYYDETTAEHAPLDVIVDLEAVSRSRPGWPQVTRLLAREHGFALVPYPTVEVASCADAHRALAEATKDAGKLVSELLQALGEGDLNASEAREFLPDAQAAEEAFVRIRVLLKHVIEECR